MQLSHSYLNPLIYLQFQNINYFLLSLYSKVSADRIENLLGFDAEMNSNPISLGNDFTNHFTAFLFSI